MGGIFFDFMRKQFSFFFFVLVLFTSCVTTRRTDLESVYVPEVFEWTEVCPGVARFDFENPEFPVIYHAVKIDLAEACEDGSLKLVCSRGERASDFAAREKCVVAINATPFDKTGELVGLHREAGRDLSEPVARYAALAFRVGGGDGSGVLAKIFASQGDPEIDEFPYAFGGFFTVLENGVVRQDFIQRQDSRSGAGLSADGRTLFLLVVEGEWTLQSAGLSYPQCGEIFRAMGCYDALEFDGGGSAELCINGKSVLPYKVYRVHGNCFGFKLR